MGSQSNRWILPILRIGRGHHVPDFLTNTFGLFVYTHTLIFIYTNEDIYENPSENTDTSTYTNHFRDHMKREYGHRQTDRDLTPTVHAQHDNWNTGVQGTMFMHVVTFHGFTSKLTNSNFTTKSYM